jgi:hypothetical protein
MISIATLGKFWPQAGHGVLSDGGEYGVNTMTEQFRFEDRREPIMKVVLTKDKTGERRGLKVSLVNEES